MSNGAHRLSRPEMVGRPGPTCQSNTRATRDPRLAGRHTLAVERHQARQRTAIAGRVLGPTIGGKLSPRFWGLLSGIVAGGVAIRVAYVMLVTRVEDKSLYDSFWYGVTANEFTQGQFFRTPFGTASTAAHPPMTSMFLGVASFVIGRHRGTTSQRLVMAVLGALVVLCVGLLGRAVAGPWIGVTAAGLAAVVPDFWIPSGIIMSETPAMLLTALTLLAVVRLLRSPDLWSAALLGAACGAVALTRAELILFLPALLIPAVLAARSYSVRRKLALLGTGTLVACLVMAPWVVRNLAAFHETTTLSTGEGLALLGANCPQTYSAPDLGSWSLQCSLSQRPGGDESVVSATDQDLALRYAEHHAGRLPLVVLARIGRLWDLYQPIQEAHIESNEGRPVPASLAGLAVYYLVIPLGHCRCGHLSAAPRPPMVPSGACRRPHPSERCGVRPHPLP